MPGMGFGGMEHVFLDEAELARLEFALQEELAKRCDVHTERCPRLPVIVSALRRAGYRLHVTTVPLVDAPKAAGNPTSEG